MDQSVNRNRLWVIAVPVGFVVLLWTVYTTAFWTSVPKPTFGASVIDQSVAVLEMDVAECRVLLTVTSPLPCANVPMDLRIDFSELIEKLGLTGVLDPNMIRVFDVLLEVTTVCELSHNCRVLLIAHEVENLEVIRGARSRQLRDTGRVFYHFGVTILFYDGHATSPLATGGSSLSSRESGPTMPKRGDDFDRYS